MGQENKQEKILQNVGPRLKQLRTERGLTLGELSEETGIAVSTLSRLENGQRSPALELLLSLSQCYRVPLDDLVGVPETADPRVQLQPKTVGGRKVWPLTNNSSGVQALKMELPPTIRPIELRTHGGYEWFYVLRGHVRLLLGTRDLVLGEGEAVEFDTKEPHWFGSANTETAEILSLFSREGVRMHLREDA